MRRLITVGRASAARCMATLALSLGALIRGGAFVWAEGPSGPDRTSAGLHVLATSFPLTWWGWLWILAGLFGLYSVAMRRYLIVTSILGGLCVAWGLSYLLGWLWPPPGSDHSRDWISAGTYLSFGIAVWASTRLIDVKPALLSTAGGD